MAEVLKRAKALAVNPLKTSQPMGASLAVLGLNRAIPLLHGSQGCATFAKVFFVRHFREPISLQTTALDAVSSIMGADDNIIEGLRTLCERSCPAVIGLLTTGLTEAQGSDIHRVVKLFGERHPEFQATRILPVNCPDFEGCLETGFAIAVQAMIDAWVPTTGHRPGSHPHQINVLASAQLTPGDLEALKELIMAFGLHPVVIPDISDSLDGHLTAVDFSPVTIGGTPPTAFTALGNAVATLAIGASLYPAAELLRERTGVPIYCFEHLLGLEATDALVLTLAGISGQAPPPQLERQRAQLQDTLLDTHFLLGQARCAIAADPDTLYAFCCLLAEVGAEIVAAVASCRSSLLERAPVTQVQIGDLEDLEQLAGRGEAEVIISNSHAAAVAGRLQLPLLRAGFPLYDQIGGYQRTWIGYRGGRQALFDLANLLLAHGQHGIEPYHSIYSHKPDDRAEANYGLTAASAPRSRAH